MRLMQHMFPQLLTEMPEQIAPRIVVPEGAVLAKAFDPFTAIGNAVTGVANAFSAGANSRANQEAYRQQTIQANIAATSAAEARAQQLAILKFIVPAALVAFTLYLIFK
jgi:hypothetical protein